MEVLVGIGVGVAILYFVFRSGFMLAVSASKASSAGAKRSQATDRNNLLSTWRREMANILLWRDPERYLRLYQALHTEISAYKGWKPATLQTKFDVLAKMYPQYEDFDAIGTRRLTLLHGLADDFRQRLQPPPPPGPKLPEDLED